VKKTEGCANEKVAQRGGDMRIRKREGKRKLARKYAENE